MAKVIAVANQKGGVGKTVTALSLSAALVELGQSVLAVDLDPQTSLTAAALGERIAAGIDEGPTAFDAVCRSRKIDRGDLQLAGEGFSVLPGSYNLVGAERLIAGDGDSHSRLRASIGEVSRTFDFVLIDCPPGLGVLMINALTAATHVLVPVSLRFVDSRGLVLLLDTVERVRTSYNPSLAVLGILPTMVRWRSRHGDEVRELLEEHFAELLIEPGIPDTVAFWAAHASLTSILSFESNSVGAAAYRAVAQEVIRRA